MYGLLHGAFRPEKHFASWVGLSPNNRITATVHKLTIQIYRMLKYGKDYVDKGQGYYEK